MAGEARLRRPHEFRNLVHLPQHGVGVFQQRAAGAGQPHAAPVTHEKADSELLLQLHQLAAEGGLRDVQDDRGAADASSPRHLDEIAKSTDVDGAPPSAVAAARTLVMDAVVAATFPDVKSPFGTVSP